MSRESSIPPVIRICHLAGGLSALNNPGPRVQLSAGIDSPILAEFEVALFPQLFGILSGGGVVVVGCEFITDIDQIHGLRPPDFRIFDTTSGWMTNSARQRWSQIASESLSVDRMELANCAARISFELDAVEHRCCELSHAYSNQLRSISIHGDLEEYKRFADLNSGPVMHGIHAMFYELAVLRDYLAEFIACHVLEIRTQKGAPIRTMTKLSEHFTSHPTPDPLCQEIREITERQESTPGWLAVLSAYRNLFAHVAPLEHLATRNFAVQTYRDSRWGRLPILYHPLPANVIQLKQTRSNRFPFDTFKEWAHASANNRPEPKDQPDALEYLHATTNRLANLALRLVSRSPVPPKEMHITSADIIGSITIRKTR